MTATSSLNSGVRVIAYYLPQFHPIPENDEWWGKGFTEWTNTAKARPLFRGHYQPHIPADLGFYDLRLPETRLAQAALAAEYGIHAFCYYHYWFGGKRLLERPFTEVVTSGAPDFPFCVCWANQTWTGVWHGAPGRILIEQTYPGWDDHRRHFEALLPAFCDKRYLKVDGKPLFHIYDPFNLPEPKRVLEFWRTMAGEAGLGDLYIVGLCESETWDPKSFGFDATVITQLPPLRKQSVPWTRPLARINNNIQRLMGKPTVYEYEDVIDWFVRDQVPGIDSFPTVIPNWDNTPRSGDKGLVLNGSTPELFARHVRKALARVRGHEREKRLVFLKSWNEWAEGNHVEPDLREGHRYLQAVRDELMAISSPRA
jgi:lipopolysaccharide biosynthesis protein